MLEILSQLDGFDVLKKAEQDIFRLAPVGGTTPAASI